MRKIKKDFFENDETRERENTGTRINKYLADSGVLSRRAADKAVEDGRVRIDGELAVMGSKVMPGSAVTLDGKEVTKESELVLIAFNKPVGIVCTTDRRDPDNIIDFISYGKRIYPIGRLDKDSQGLILLTNDGDMVNRILRAGNEHEKEYIVTVNKPLTDAFAAAMSRGVEIERGVVTKPCKVYRESDTTFRIILTQGLNRQIRRMCEALDYRVRSLTRVRIMNVTLGRLKTGTYRNLTEEELTTLSGMIKNSKSAPGAQPGTAKRSKKPATAQKKRTDGASRLGGTDGKRRDHKQAERADHRTHRTP